MTFAERLRRMLAAPLRMPAPRDCPLPECSTCVPAEMAAESSHAAEVSRAGWWLISAYPDAWYFEDPAHVFAVADDLVRLRARVDAGRVAP